MLARVSVRRSDRTLPTIHGGDVDGVARAYGVPADRLIDFSANINPMGPPRRALMRLAREAADRQHSENMRVRCTRAGVECGACPWTRRADSSSMAIG
jgi:hypothetical protein